MKATQPPPTPVRLPAELKEWLKAQAASNSRSLNKELIHRLGQSRAQDGAAP